MTDIYPTNKQVITAVCSHYIHVTFPHTLGPTYTW